MSRVAKTTDYSYILTLLAITIAAPAVLVAVHFLPLASREQPIVELAKASEYHKLQPQKTLQQRFIALPGTYSAVVLYADADGLGDRKLAVRIVDENGEELARGRKPNVTYVTSDDTLRLEFPITWLPVAASRHVYAAVTLLSGSALPLRVTSVNTDVYHSGELTADGQGLKRDLALALITRTTLPFGARQGVIGGLVLMVGLALIRPIQQRKTGWLAAAVLVAAVTPLAIGGYWFSDDRLGISDWDYYFPLHHSYRASLLEHHTFPFWNPYTCGGTAGLADPEFPVFSLTFLLELLLGIPVGLRLAIFLSVIVGTWGYLALGKRLGLTVLAAVLTALAAAFGSVNLLEITEGHVNVFTAMWIPWIFWSWLGAYRGTTRPLMCGIFLAAVFLQGGVYLLMYTALAFLILPLLVSRPARALAVATQSGLWGLGLASIKLIPVLFWLVQFPDETYAGSTFSLPWLADIFFGRHLHGADIIFRQGSGWHEYGAYIGYIVFALAVIGLSQAAKSRFVRGLVLASLLAAGLSVSGPGLEPLFDLLWFFPRSSISRIILFAVIPLSVLAGVGLDRLQKHGRTAQLAVLFLVGAVAVDLFSLSYRLSQQAFVLPHVYPLIRTAPYPIAFTPQRFDLAGAANRTTRTYDAAVAGYGTLAYCSVLGPYPHVRTIYDDGNGIINLAGDGSYKLIAWSPNEVRVQVQLPAPTDAVLNTNYAKGWEVNGRPAREIAERVGVSLPAGVHDLTFRYKAPGFWLGLSVMLATVAVASGTFMPWRRFRWARETGVRKSDD